MKFNRLAARVFNTPLAIHPPKLDVIVAVMRPRFGMDSESGPTLAGEPEKREIYSVDPAGIAVIAISGTLVNRSSGMDAWSGMTSYEEILGEIARAVADPAVKGIMLRLESPGGEALGLAGISQAVRDAGKQKPVWSAIDAYAFSAAYWIASACEQICIPVDGEVGSIGCIAKHCDFSAYNEEQGFKVTAIFYGAHKNDFSQDQPLSTDAAARLQADVDELGGMFVSAVAKNRGMAKAAVRATEALTYIGQKAVDVGLADQIACFSDAMIAFADALATGKRAAPAVIVPRPVSGVEKRVGNPLVQRRYCAGELRSEAGGEPQIKGHMAVFDRWSGDVGGYIEVIKPGAFTKTLKDGGDIHSYFNHDSNFVLGRVKADTLRLTESDTGLYSENLPPDTQTIRDLVLEPIRRGDVDQGSIAFRAVRQEWGRVDGVITRTLHEVRLYHVSPVARGAYEDTDIGLYDFTALAAVLAKQDQGIALTQSERALLTQSIEAFQKGLTVAPGLAAHPAEAKTEPPPDIAALQNRLRRVQMLLIQ